ncbi:L,D-transpeptidase [Streptomyces sp. NPDC054766]|uniref:L,D-transpeptidase n=1 Tax=Streptomyces rhizosphaerihabitans TaxID=1266770 RepID=UPI0021BE32EE|nr:Ig-like domain-containing protein [Streptomyces rhizosphaerihabitans]MCT9009531.1 Ig-like domain-containing protein [Streptomyces rhizosphaerihabitans]
MGVPEISNRPESAPEAPGRARPRPGRPAWSRRGVLAAFGAAVPALTLSGCGDSADAAEGKGATATGGAGAGTTAKAQVRTPAVTVSPADGTKKADFTSPVEVSVADGTLSTVEVSGNDGSLLAGSFNDDRTRWTSARNPYSGTKYTVTAKAAGASEHTASFVTKSPGETFAGYFTPEANSTSGVGMPVSINFTKAVTDRAAVERAITVTSDPAVEVVGHWFGDTRLDFRPARYWAAGTKITLSLRLKDVEATDGVYGVQSKDVTFHIGRRQVSTIDLSKKTMTVERDGAALARYPVSGGAADHTTWSGIMVISERFKETRMESSTVGLGDEYDIADVPHAQRLTTSGTFIHGNYWASASVFGSSNTSHGCVGLHDTKGANNSSVPGYKFYESSMLGDVVVVENSGERTVEASNGLNGWNLSWADWTAGSAI